MELMLGILELNIDTFKAYFGNGLILIPYAAALVYIFACEKKLWIKLVLGVMPIIVFAAFFIPQVRLVYDKLMGDSATFYRVLWLIPFGMTVAYAFVSFFAAHKVTGLVAALAIAVLCGSNVYDSALAYKATNPYGLRQYVINVCDMIAPSDEDGRIFVCVPAEMVHQARQYNPNIMLLYGRENVEPEWAYQYDYDALDEFMKSKNPDISSLDRIFSSMLVYSLMNAEEIDMESLIYVLEELNCKYLVLGADKKKTAKPTEYGWEYFGETDGYYIYENPKMRGKQWYEASE